MADSSANIAFSKEILEDLTRLARVKNQSVQELAKEFIQEAIEHEEDRILIERAAKLNTPGAETVNFEDVKWD